MLKISVANRFQLRIASEFGGIFRSKNGTDIHYIGGAEILPAPFSAEEEKEILAKLGSSHDKEARSSLIEHNLRLVVYIAKKFENTGIGVEDLISIGTIGLIKAINTYDISKGHRLVTYAARCIELATYASRCIENEILMFLRRNNKVKYEVSIDEPLNVDWDGNELLLSDILGTDEDVISKGLEDEVDRRLLRQALGLLSERERSIIELRFGIDRKDGKEFTQKEVADMMGISQSYISRLEKKIMKRLKKEILRMQQV